MIKLGKNIASLAAQQQLNKTSASLSKTFERLSSGLRINHASDDPAGLAIASQLNSDSRVYSQALRNVNDGISYLNIADSALGALSGIGTRLKELATQSANGAYSLTQRQALAKEADALVNEYNRIIESTKYNDISIFDPASQNLMIQAGYGTKGAISLDLGASMQRAIWDGTYSTGQLLDIYNSGETQKYGDFNGDGKLDIAWGDSGLNEALIYLGNGDGTFGTAITITTSTGYSIRSIGDFNGDGKDDLVAASSTEASILLSNGDGTFTQSQSTALYSGQAGDGSAADLNGDGKLDLVFRGNSGYTVLIGNGDGTFQNARSYASTFTGLSAGDINSDGKVDLYGTTTGGRYAVAYGTGNGTFGPLISYLPPSGGVNYFTADLNRDGIADIINALGTNGYTTQLGNGDGTFRPEVSYPTSPDLYAPFGTGSVLDINGDGIADFSALLLTGDMELFVASILGNGDGTLRTPVTGIMPDSENGFVFGYAIPRDFNNDGVFDFFGSNQDTNQIIIGLAGTDQTPTIAYLDLTSQSSAQSAMNSADNILKNISTQRGLIGAALSRLEIAAGNLQSSKTNIDAAAGRIMDADIASDAAALVRLKILQQTGAAILAQANLQPSIALQLLKSPENK